MTFIQLVNHFKTQAAVAKALGISGVAVSLMQTRGIPHGRQCELQILTGGVLQADQKAKKAA